jgi:DNA-binding MarR family transcriptional regulator
MNVSNHDNKVKNYDYNSEKEFIEVVYRRYDLLRQLYPKKTKSTKEMLETLNISKGNFSKKLQDLKAHELVEVSTEVSGTGRPPQSISLAHDGREILKKIIELKSPSQSQEQLPKLPDLTLMYQCLDLFAQEDLDLKQLAADEFQLLTQRYHIILETQFFKLFKKIIKDKTNNAILHTLLNSLLNIIKNSDSETRNKIDSELGYAIFTLNNASRESHIFKVIEEITIDLIKSKSKPSLLFERYLSLMKKNPEQIGDVRTLILKNVSPEKKTELRIRLLQEFKEADQAIRDIIEVELTQLR